MGYLHMFEWFRSRYHLHQKPGIDERRKDPRQPRLFDFAYQQKMFVPQTPQQKRYGLCNSLKILDDQWWNAVFAEEFIISEFLTGKPSGMKLPVLRTPRPSSPRALQSVQHFGDGQQVATVEQTARRLTCRETLWEVPRPPLVLANTELSILPGRGPGTNWATLHTLHWVHFPLLILLCSAFTMVVQGLVYTI